MLCTYRKKESSSRICFEIARYLEGKEGGKVVPSEEFDISSKAGMKLFAKLYDQFGPNLYNEQGRIEVPILIKENASGMELIAQGKEIKHMVL